MRDLVLYLHLLIGLALIILPMVIILSKNNQPTVNKLALLVAALSWALLYPAGKLYITFYPATKTLIKASSWPWAHSLVMETKEHWGLLLPIIATVAAGLTIQNKNDQAKRWWILVVVLSILLGVMGRLIKIGALK